jgi:hypothetical protein
MSPQAGVEKITDWHERESHPGELGVDKLMSWCRYGVFVAFRFWGVDEEEGKLRGVGTCIGEGGVGGSCYRY